MDETGTKTMIQTDSIACALNMHPASAFKRICEPLCTIPNDKETDVFDSDTSFVVLLQDSRFDYFVRLVEAKPYISVDNKLTYYGWVDKSNTPYSNDHFPVCPNDYEKVIAFAQSDAIVAPLSHCPFCGSAKELKDVNAGVELGDPEYAVRCKNCGLFQGLRA